jgi:hypothetical protein
MNNSKEYNIEDDKYEPVIIEICRFTSNYLLSIIDMYSLQNDELVEPNLDSYNYDDFYDMYNY